MESFYGRVRRLSTPRFIDDPESRLKSASRPVATIVPYEARWQAVDSGRIQKAWNVSNKVRDSMS